MSNTEHEFVSSSAVTHLDQFHEHVFTRFLDVLSVDVLGLREHSVSLEEFAVRPSEAV